MLLTRASEYAILSLILIAKEKLPQDADGLSKKLDISKSFLAKILQNLAKDGILNSYKGAKGGFELSKPVEDITLLEIIKASEGKHPKVFACSVGRDDCVRKPDYICGLQPLFNNLQIKIDDFLLTIKLSDLIIKEA